MRWLKAPATISICDANSRFVAAGLANKRGNTSASRLTSSRRFESANLSPLQRALPKRPDFREIRGRSLPPFADMTAGAGGPANVPMQFLVLGILVLLTAIPFDVIVAMLGATASGMINRNQTARQGLAWVGGLTMIAIAVNLHLGFI